MAEQGAARVTGLEPRAIVLPAREVPLGGLRAMNVQRSLPQRSLPTVGAWCFLDRFGPQRTTMRVEPHPHMGLQTVTWPLTGRVRHKDSLGSDVILRPGELNVMTSGAGIAHSEYSLADHVVADGEVSADAGEVETEAGEADLDALQLWIALPEHARWEARGFEHHEALPVLRLPAVEGAPAEATVIMGSLAGATSPATTYSPLVGAQTRVAPGSRLFIPLVREWEHAIVLLEGDVTVGESVDASVDVGERPSRNDLMHLGAHRDQVEVASAQGALVFLLGGEPFEEELVMWWNFVGRSHNEIADARLAWESRSSRFGEVEGHGVVRIPAPPMPSVRLTPRRRRSAR